MRLGGAPPRRKVETLPGKPLETEPVATSVKPMVSPTRIDKPADEFKVPSKPADLIPIEGFSEPPTEKSPPPHDTDASDHVSGTESPVAESPPANASPAPEQSAPEPATPEPTAPEPTTPESTAAAPAPVDHETPATKTVSTGHDFDEVDALIEVGEMGARPPSPVTDEPAVAQPAKSEGPTSDPEVVAESVAQPAEIQDNSGSPGDRSAEELPIAETVDSGAGLDEMPIVIDSGEKLGEVEDDEASFEVLDDSDEDVIDLSDGDIVVGLAPAPTAGADLARMPAPPPAPVAHAAPVVAERVVQPAMPAGTAPAQTPGQPTPTSLNPAYKAFGPPPPAHYPDEPPVPDGPSAEASVGATTSIAGFSGRPMNRGGVNAEAIFALIASFLGAVFGLWISFQSYQIVSWFLPGTTTFESGRLTGQAGILAFIYGFRLLAGLGLLAGGCLFFINEIIRLNGSDPMPYSCIIALIAGCFFLLVEFGLGCYAVFNMTAMSAYGINSGGTLFLILIFTFLRCLIPVAMVVFAALRQR